MTTTQVGDRVILGIDFVNGYSVGTVIRIDNDVAYIRWREDQSVLPYRKNFIDTCPRACLHCSRPLSEHSSGEHCLFSPTRYEDRHGGA